MHEFCKSEFFFVQVWRYKPKRQCMMRMARSAPSPCTTRSLKYFGCRLKNGNICSSLFWPMTIIMFLYSNRIRALSVSTNFSWIHTICCSVSDDAVYSWRSRSELLHRRLIYSRERKKQQVETQIKTKWTSCLDKREHNVLKKLINNSSS